MNRGSLTQHLRVLCGAVALLSVALACLHHRLWLLAGAGAGLVLVVSAVIEMVFSSRCWLPHPDMSFDEMVFRAGATRLPARRRPAVRNRVKLALDRQPDDARWRRN